MYTTLRKHPYLTLLFISLFLYLIGNQLLPVTDTAESNYALTAKEMVLSNDWISPQIYGHYWYDKPIFYYWELALSYTLFGFNEMASRLPAALLGSASSSSLTGLPAMSTAKRSAGYLPSSWAPRSNAGSSRKPSSLTRHSSSS